MRFERKIELSFLKLSFKISDLQKEFVHAVAVLGYLIKLKIGLELTFDAHFLHGFFHTKAPYLILIN